MIDDVVEAGPNAILSCRREGYKKGSFSFKECKETLSYSGFRKMALRYWKMGISEMYRSFNKGAFARELQKLVPEIDKSDLLRAESGVRAQAILPDGRLLDDFAILANDRMIHVLNAPSPAATSSLSIAEYIVDLAKKHF